MRNQEYFVIYYFCFSKSKNSSSLRSVLSTTCVFHMDELFGKIQQQSQVVVRVVLNRRQHVSLLTFRV